MDNLNHLLFAILLITPFGISSYRFAMKALLMYGAAVAIGYLVFDLSMNFVSFTGFLAYIIIFYILYMAWTGKKPFFKLFLLSLSTVFVAGQSHSADRFLGFFTEVPSMSSPFRPHNFWHAPFFAILLSALVALILPRILNSIGEIVRNKTQFQLKKFETKFLPLFSITFLGYLFHIFADSITYDFDVWWLFPFSDVHFSLYDLANAGKLLATDVANPWGWVYYYLTPALIVIAAIYLGLGYLSKSDPE